ncbi:hypothetical protein [Kitasatospora sp. NPDC088779]|uniref:hypothetical protein n=1 Tax=unclassified Kitasatospora TaxID=2633591 RepID=UPI00341F5C87
MAPITLKVIRYGPHLLVIVGMFTAGALWNTGNPAASFPNVLAPIAVVATGVVLAFVFPPHGRRRRR